MQSNQINFLEVLSDIPRPFSRETILRYGVTEQSVQISLPIDSVLVGTRVLEGRSDGVEESICFVIEIITEGTDFMYNMLDSFRDAGHIFTEPSFQNVVENNVFVLSSEFQDYIYNTIIYTKVINGIHYGIVDSGRRVNLRVEHRKLNEPELYMPQIVDEEGNRILRSGNTQIGSARLEHTIVRRSMDIATTYNFYADQLKQNGWTQQTCLVRKDAISLWKNDEGRSIFFTVDDFERDAAHLLLLMNRKQ